MMMNDRFVANLQLKWIRMLMHNGYDYGRAGSFYLMQTTPELIHGKIRIKFGFSYNPEKRKKQFATIAPSIEIIKEWECIPQWEDFVIDMATSFDTSGWHETGDGCKQISKEVFDIANLDTMINKIDSIFSWAKMQKNYKIHIVPRLKGRPKGEKLFETINLQLLS